MHANCPECNDVVEFRDVRRERCRHCGTKICIPKAYFRPASIGACLFTLITIVSTGGYVWVSPPVFSYLMLWLVAMLATFLVALFACVWVWWRISPPPVERIHANDTVTRLRLDD